VCESLERSVGDAPPQSSTAYSGLGGILYSANTFLDKAKQSIIKNLSQSNCWLPSSSPTWEWRRSMQRK
jgi:hypothetical protein